MNIKRVFVDANVIIDMFDKHRENCIAANIIMNYFVDNDIELYTSCDLVTTVYYILSKRGKKKALENVKEASNIFELIPFSNEDLSNAIYLMEKNQNFKDLEDTLQYVLAKKEGCDLILTNDKDFYSPDIKTATTSQILEKIRNK